MSENLPTTEEENGVVTESDDWSEAPVIDNTGTAQVRDFDAASDDHPLVQHAGQKAKKTDLSGGGEFVSEEIYDSDEAFWREWLQNHETACIRRCKMEIELSDEYPDGWLTHTVWVDIETGETVIGVGDDEEGLAKYDGDAEDLRAIEVPREISEVREAAKSLGYVPTITWDVFRDERKMITEDNGIGMTPKEFWKAFKSPFSSGSGVDAETGGNFGIGSNSIEKVHGAEGGAEILTKTPRPGDWEGYNAYSYRGGATAVDGPVPDDFYGTRFEVPIQESFNLSGSQESIEKYADKLRIPILYREHDAGSTAVEEEYEATKFTEDFDDAPITVERPGEFTIVSGPNVCPKTSYHEPDNPDTYLISMQIERNTSGYVDTMYDVVVQIHDEQGRIVMGPHRGMYSDGNYVYPTAQKKKRVDELDDDDVPMPQPTGDRDRLKKNETNTSFFEYVEDIITEKEMDRISEIVHDMKEADHPVDVIRDEPGVWDLFDSTISKHGYRAKSSLDRFKDFIESWDSFPDLDDSRIKQMYELFTSVSVCTKGPSRSSKKKYRVNQRIGYIYANRNPDEIYMTVSTSGHFSDKFKVVENTHNSVDVVVISGSPKYDHYGDVFGWNILKDVPVTKSNEDNPHNFDVADSVHQEHTKTKSSTTSKADSIEERVLKIRNDSENTAIDVRMTISDVKEKLEEKKFICSERVLVLFPRTDDRNISDHYDLAEYAAIASVSKTEYEKLAGYERVMTYDEFIEWSESALIATEDGAMTPEELVRDDRMVILAYDDYQHSALPLLKDENSELVEYYKEDIRDQIAWAKLLDGYDGGYKGDDVGNVPDDDKPNILLAVVDNVVLDRALWKFHQLNWTPQDIVGFKPGSGKYGYKEPVKWRSLDGSGRKYKLKTETPNWDDSSTVYEIFPGNHDSLKANLMLALHDKNIDPTNHTNEEVREML